MGNFIAKRWAYIDDAGVWVHHAPDAKTTPDYMNALYPVNNADSETKFEYLSGDGEPTQEFVDAGLKPH